MPDTPYYYANCAAVGHTEYDFILSVLRTPSQLTAEQTTLTKQEKPIPIEPLLQISLPPRLIGGLIRAFTEQRRRYEKEFGPIRQEKTGNDTEYPMLEDLREESRIRLRSRIKQ